MITKLIKQYRGFMAGIILFIVGLTINPFNKPKNEIVTQTIQLTGVTPVVNETETLTQRAKELYGQELDLQLEKQKVNDRIVDLDKEIISVRKERDTIKAKLINYDKVNFTQE